MANSAPHSVILLVGHGRSGSNWLLDLLSLSEVTHCRSEPNEQPDAQLTGFSTPEAKLIDRPDMESGWDQALWGTAVCMGEQDRPIRGRKTYLWSWASALGLPALVQRERSRRVLGVLWPSLRRGEWPLPGWLGSNERMLEATHVVKVLMAPGWADWVLRTRPQTRVIHLLRHPGGYLNSWRRRYLAPRDESEVLAANIDRLRRVRELDPMPALADLDLDRLTVEASELWYWRYMNELLFATGETSEAYRRVTFEQLTADPVHEAQRMYEFCDVPWTEDIACQVEAMSVRSAEISRKWQSALSGEDADLIRHVLEGSSLETLWPDE